VDAAETAEGRAAAWAVNVTGVAALARVATAYGLTLVHVSSDYVFDGTSDRPYREDDPLCPLGVYGQTKAAGDGVAATVPRHYIVRTSWVVGDGKNFVRTMASLADRGVDPRVVDDQIGRLTFTDDIAHGIHHLLSTHAPFGTYNLTNTGPAVSWAGIARQVFALTGHDPARVTGVSTEDYFSQAAMPIAPRPRNSVLELKKIRGVGVTPETWDARLRAALR
jgi:dTDP-4-dehydrorhamnose 3,5-epimerase